MESEEEAISIAIDNLRYEPVIIREDDVEILGIYEVDYESGERINDT